MRKKILFGVVLIFLVGGAMTLTQHSGWLDLPEQTYYDLWHHLSGIRYPPSHVVIVAIDDKTRLDFQDEPLVFWSPRFAQAIKVLRQAGARVVGLDYLFTVSPESWLKKLNLPGSQESRTYDQPFREQLASGVAVLVANLLIDDQGKSKVVLPLRDYWHSLPRFLDDVGFATFYNDADGVIRRFAFLMPDGDGQVWASFAFLLAERAQEKPPVPVERPLAPISFTGPPGTVPRLSFRQLLKPMAEMDPAVLSLRDKVVIVGSEFSGQPDIFLTPYARGFLGLGTTMMSGVEVHANIVETLLSGRFLREIPLWLSVIYFLAILGLGVAVFFRLSPMAGFAGLAILCLAAAVASFLVFRQDVILPAAGVQIGLILCYLGTLGLRLTGEERERARLRLLFGRYVADKVVDRLLATGTQPNLGGEAVPITVLFADIRQFTRIAETLPARDVVEMLNHYFSRICEPILEAGGTVDKFMGDGIMAIFGSPVPYPDHARRALKTSLAIADAAQEFRGWMTEHFTGYALPDFAIGIGLHTGEAIVGNIGSPRRLEFTAVGDTVNLASRLETLTKELDWNIVASNATVIAAGLGVKVGRKQEVALRGHQATVEVCEILGLDED